MERAIDYLVQPYLTYEWWAIALEVVAAIFGVASVLYSRAENIKVYPTGIISTAIYVFLLYQAGLFGDMGINAYYFAMSIYGWINWAHVNDEGESLQIEWASLRDNLIGFNLLIVGYFFFSYILEEFTTSTVPHIDGFTTSIFFVGMWFMAKKKVENWIYWIVGDLITIPLYIYKGLGISAIQFAFFTILAVLGYFEWRRKANQSQATT
ncbi:MAG: nicotinamide riboside transporter PnuC [Bacteroidota bacterium]